MRSSFLIVELSRSVSLFRFFGYMCIYVRSLASFDHFCRSPSILSLLLLSFLLSRLSQECRMIMSDMRDWVFLLLNSTSLFSSNLKKATREKKLPIPQRWFRSSFYSFCFDLRNFPIYHYVTILFACLAIIVWEIFHILDLHEVCDWSTVLYPLIT